MIRQHLNVCFTSREQSKSKAKALPKSASDHVPAHTNHSCLTRHAAYSFLNVLWKSKTTSKDIYTLKSGTSEDERSGGSSYSKSLVQFWYSNATQLTSLTTWKNTTNCSLMEAKTNSAMLPSTPPITVSLCRAAAYPPASQMHTNTAPMHLAKDVSSKHGA